MHRRRFALLVLGMTLLGPFLRAEIRFEPDGRVLIPAADCLIKDRRATVTFKATRWGMYELEARFKAGAKVGPVTATINGEGPRRASEQANQPGTFYLAKAGPCRVEVMGPVGALSSLVLVPACEGEEVVQEGFEPIELDARDCTIEGVMLRYEPNPKKLCLGFWGNPKDQPRWDYTVTTPGTYEVILTQGCGKGAGGSEAVLETVGTELAFTVHDTGGYQNWVERRLGTVTFKEAGKQVLRVRVVKKARGIMDIRRIVLQPVH